MTRAEQVAAAEKKLAKSIPALKRVIASDGPFPVKARRSARDFDSLASSIVYQQLTGKVGDVFYQRLLDLCGTADLEAEFLARVRRDKLRSIGLSNAKTDTMKALARAVVAGEIDFASLRKKTDQEIINAVTVIKGIGPWTVQMFLLFQLGRMDVWPVTDYGVQKGMTTLMKHPELLKPKEMAEVGQPHVGYRSVLAWYAWRVADTKTPASRAT